MTLKEKAKLKRLFDKRKKLVVQNLSQINKINKKVYKVDAEIEKLTGKNPGNLFSGLKEKKLSL